MHVPERVIRPQTPTTLPVTKWQASAELPTRFGLFQTHVFRTTLSAREPGDASFKEHVAMVFGDIRGASDLPIRIHSECMTSEVFGSLKCDCKEQLDAALTEVALRGAGAVLYLRQEGRGIGLANKIRAYALQDQGYDTVEANHQLGFAADLRDYTVGARILFDLGVRKLKLMTNNPDKVRSAEEQGLIVVERRQLEVPTRAANRRYMETKQTKFGHLLSLVGERGESS